MISNKKIFITGFNGSLTKNFLSFLKKETKNCEIFVSTTSKRKIKKNNLYKVIKVSKYYNNFSKVQKIINKCDFFFHFAYQNSESFSTMHPLKDFKINIITLKNILKTVNNSKNLTFIFSSTVSLYRSSKKKINENSEINILSYYNLHKLYCENEIFLNSLKSENKFIILRLSNVYGDTDIIKRDFVFFTINNIKRNNQIHIFGTGNYLRDFININDVSNAFLKIIKHKTEKKFNIFNLCSGSSITIKKLVTLLILNLKNKGVIYNKKFKYIKNNTELVSRNFVCNPRLFKKKYNWKPKIKIVDGIKKLINKL